MATRTWVSGVGDDANPGSRTAPCKTFAGAISKTDPGGEIDVIDPGAFGAVTITKSVTIDATGNFASILASGTTGIIINAAGINVIIRGVQINGAGGGITGIRIIAANRVHIQDCVIFGCTGGVAIGINDVRTTGGKLFITNTTVRENGQTGVQILPASGSTAIQAFLDDARLQGNGNAGLTASTGSRVTISNSFVSGNTNFGVFANSAVPAAPSELNALSCIVVGNGQGVVADINSTVRISNMHITNNTIGLTGGTFATFGNNRIAGNGSGNTVPGGPAPIAPQ
jgi:hypothetical protein